MVKGLVLAFNPPARCRVTLGRMQARLGEPSSLASFQAISAEGSSSQPSQPGPVRARG